MTRGSYSDWAIVAAAFGFLAFVLLSPTGSLVRKGEAAANAGTAPRVVELTPPGPLAGLVPAPLE